jgi:hypothetical protein
LSDENIEIVGFDLGHGESALACTRLNAATEPVALDLGGTRSIVTAVGRDAEGRIAIGREVIALSSRLIESHVRFKHVDLDHHPSAGKATRLFVRGVLDRLIGSRQIGDPDRVFFLVGCPSGWGPRTQAAYQSLLEQAGLKTVRVVPESRAAFLHAREMRELPEAELSRRVLLIDIGSSTTDFTFSDRLNAHPVDFGHTEAGDIGAGLLDQAILLHAISNHPDSDAVRAFLQRSPGKQAEIDLKCRDAKHEYFNEKQGTGGEVWQAVRLDRGAQLEIVLDDVIMERIKAMPLDALGGRSFVQALRDRLNAARERLDDAPDHILVTGGAARMGFATGLIEEVFSGIRPVRGREPELAVAKGLAWFGRSQLNAQAFQRDVEQLIAGGQIEELVGRAVPTLFSRLAVDLGSALVNGVLRQELMRWRQGETATLLDMEGRARAAMESFLAGVDASRIVAEATADWFEEIRPKLQSLTDPICLRYRLPTSALQLTPDTYFSTKAPEMVGIAGVVSDDFDQIGTVVNALVATVSGVVLGGAGATLLHVPLIGHLLAGIGVFAALTVGKGVMREQVKAIALPVLVRRLVTEAKIDAKLRESQPALVSGLRDSLIAAEADAAPGARLADRVASQIDQGLRQRGDDAILRF